MSEYHDIPSNERVIEGSFYFDTSLNGLPVVQLEWTDGRKEPCRQLEVELVSPSGNIIPDTSFVRANTFIRIEPSSRQVRYFVSLFIFIFTLNNNIAQE